MKNYSSALILIAAAIVWNGSATFYNGVGRYSDNIGVVGICLACLLLLIALFKWGHDV